MQRKKYEAAGSLLRSARERMGQSQGEGAERLGVDQSLLSRYENGIVRPTLERLYRIEEIYGVAVSRWRLDSSDNGGRAA